MGRISILRRLWAETDGVTSIEYGLIAALIFLVMVTAVNALSQKNSSTYQKVKDAIVAAEQ